MTLTRGVLDVEPAQAGPDAGQLSAQSVETAGAFPSPGTFQDAGGTREASIARSLEPVHRRRYDKLPSTTGHIDAALLEKALALVDSIVPSEEINTPLFLAALSGTVLEMWESAATSSECHQDILAALESAVRSATDTGSVTEQQLSAFREAITDLARTRLVHTNAEVVRSEFIRQGFGPLAFVDEPDDNEYEEPS